MQKLQLYQTTPVFTNVAPGRSFTDPHELYELTLNQLVRGVAIFSFHKASDNTVRHAIGTLHPDIIPPKVLQVGVPNILQMLERFPKLYDRALVNRATVSEEELIALENNNKSVAERAENLFNKLMNPPAERKLSPDTQTFYDIQAQAWKSFKIDSLLSLMIPEDDSEQ